MPSRAQPLLGRLCAVLACGVIGCEDQWSDPREAQIVAVMAAADEPYIRARPALSAGKYTRMASSIFDFYRGTLPVFRNDMRSGGTTLAISSFSLDIPLVPSLGDPHPENFGALRASDGSLALEANDFDAADRAPYLWDVRRLSVGMALAVTLSNPEEADARSRALDARRSIVRDAMLGYRDGIEEAARGTPLGRVVEGGPVVADVFRRAERDQAIRRELADLTVLDGGRRRLKRGSIDPDDPQSVYADLPPSATASLPAALERYRATLVAPPPADQFTLLDAVRQLGSGVASWPRVRVILLVRGPSDDPSDDLMLELKELADSTTAGLYPPGVYYDSVGQRIVATSRSVWARPDGEPFWGYTDWLGFPCQVRLESEGQKGVRVDRLADEEGTPEAMSALGRAVGRIVARAHSSGPDGVANARAIYGRIALGPDRFVDEQTDAGLGYAELVIADHARFIHALRRPDGLRLGIPFDPTDAPRPDLAAVFGVPPSPPPLPAPVGSP